MLPNWSLWPKSCTLQNLGTLRVTVRYGKAMANEFHPEAMLGMDSGQPSTTVKSTVPMGCGRSKPEKKEHPCSVLAPSSKARSHLSNERNEVSVC